MELEEVRVPVLRPGLQFRPLSGDRVFISHPEIASQVVHAQIGAALRLCQGQPMSEILPRVREVLDYDCPESEWANFLAGMSRFGLFEGIPNRSPRVRLFDPGPILDFMVAKCRWAFTAPMVVLLFVLLFGGLGRLLAHWSFFVSEVLRVTAAHPSLSILLFYFCFIPVGLLHELAHGAVCRWFGGEVLEVGLHKDTANLYVLSNKAPLTTSRALIFYFAGGAFLDMFIFFALVNLWLLWPNYLTLIVLLPQALFVLQFSYAMEGGSDLSKIISEWTKIPEAEGRRAFLRSFFRVLPKTRIERVRAAIYLASIALQAGAAVMLIWSFRRPVHVAMWPGVQVSVPFFPVILYLLYRVLRYAFLNYRSLMETAGLRSAEAAG